MLSPYYETLLKDKFQQCNATYKNKAPTVILLTGESYPIVFCLIRGGASLSRFLEIALKNPKS